MIVSGSVIHTIFPNVSLRLNDPSRKNYYSVDITVKLNNIRDSMKYGNLKMVVHKSPYVPLF